MQYKELIEFMLVNLQLDKVVVIQNDIFLKGLWLFRENISIRKTEIKFKFTAHYSDLSEQLTVGEKSQINNISFRYQQTT